MSEVNPYAISATPSEDYSSPIFFAGTPTPDDVMMTLLDTAPQTGASQIKSILISCAVSGGALFLCTQAGRPIPGFIWMLIAGSFLPTWMRIAPKMVMGYRKRLGRAKESAKNVTEHAGWMNNQTFMIRDHKSAMRAKWTYFANAWAFPRHLMLPARLDQGRRIVIPWRHFYSMPDAMAAHDMLSAQTGIVANTGVDEATLSQIQDFSKVANSFEPFGLDNNEDNWPFDSGAQGQHDCTIDLGAALTGIKFIAIAGAAMLSILFLYFLPLWLAMIGWVFIQYIQTGDWSFLADDVASTTAVGFAAVLLLTFTAAAMIRSVLASRSVQKHPVSIRVRDKGVCLFHESFHSWFKWEAVDGLILDDNVVGWIDKDSKEEVRIPERCFEDEMKFDDFKIALKQLSPKP